MKKEKCAFGGGSELGAFVTHGEISDAELPGDARFCRRPLYDSANCVKIRDERILIASHNHRPNRLLRPNEQPGIAFASKNAIFREPCSSKKCPRVECQAVFGLAGLNSAPVWAPHVNTSEGLIMALQIVTARANQNGPLFQGNVGAGNVVILAHATEQTTAYPVPTSPKPRDPKRLSGRPTLFERWFAMMSSSRSRAARSAAC